VCAPLGQGSGEQEAQVINRSASRHAARACGQQPATPSSTDRDGHRGSAIRSAPSPSIRGPRDDADDRREGQLDRRKSLQPTMRSRSRRHGLYRTYNLGRGRRLDAQAHQAGILCHPRQNNLALPHQAGKGETPAARKYRPLGKINDGPLRPPTTSRGVSPPTGPRSSAATRSSSSTTARSTEGASRPPSSSRRGIA